jgi:hypothetical protein
MNESSNEVEFLSGAPASESRGRFRSAKRGVVVAASGRRCGWRWLTALLDSHPRSLCRNEPLARPYTGGLETSLRRLQRSVGISVAERERLLEEWTRGDLSTLPALFFSKQFCASSPLRQWWAWSRARWSDRFRAAYAATAAPAADQAYNLVLAQTNNTEALGPLARGLKARLFVLRRHPGAVVASQLRGMRRGYLPPVDRVGWFEENERACRELELRISAVLRMPLTDLLAYRWLVQNMQFRSALMQLPHTSLAMQFEDFCRDPAARARELFAFLGWDFGEQTRAFLRQSTGAGWLSLFNWLAGRRRYSTVIRHASTICEAWRHDLTDYEQRRILNIATALPHFHRFWPG